MRTLHRAMDPLSFCTANIQAILACRSPSPPCYLRWQGSTKILSLIPALLCPVLRDLAGPHGGRFPMDLTACWRSFILSVTSTLFRRMKQESLNHYHRDLFRFIIGHNCRVCGVVSKGTHGPGKRCFWKAWNE